MKKLKRSIIKNKLQKLRQEAVELERAGYLEHARKKILEMKSSFGTSDLARLGNIEWRLQLLNTGYPFPQETNSKLNTEKNTVAILLYNSLPYTSAGYATRSHGLALSLIKKNWKVECLTRYGFPTDIRLNEGRNVKAQEEIDAVLYSRLLPVVSEVVTIGSEKYYLLNNEAVTERIKKIRPSVIHAASNHINGIAACVAGAKLGIPTIYEVRGLWDITRASAEPEYGNSELYYQSLRLEIDVCNKVTKVCVITYALKEYLVAKGVEAEKITVVPNGVDTTRFNPMPRDQHLLHKLKLSNKVIIGYVGSMQQYEGLDILLNALFLLNGKTKSGFHFLAVGDGTELQSLKKKVSQLGLDEVVTFTGRVPYNDVDRYYSLIDICPFPRKDQLVCQLVSPLKPFEAMSMSKAIVVSDVNALKESVEHNVNGLVHNAGDEGDLAEKLRILIDDSSLIEELGKAAREWVVEHRDWQAIAKKLVGVYDSAIKLDCQSDEVHKSQMRI